MRTEYVVDNDQIKSYVSVTHIRYVAYKCYYCLHYQESPSQAIIIFQNQLELKLIKMRTFDVISIRSNIQRKAPVRCSSVCRVGTL